MKDFMEAVAKVLKNSVCQVCYATMEVLDVDGTWCKRCHKEYTTGLAFPEKRISKMEIIKKYRGN